MTRVRIAFDPGVRTGWAMYTANTLEVPQDKEDGPWTEESYDVKLTSGTIRTEGNEQIQALYQVLDQWHTHDMAVIIESFDNRIRNVHTELISLEYIGAIKGWCYTNNVRFVTQAPNEGKAFFTDDKLQACGVLARPLKEHKDANDAMRHLLHWLLKYDPNAKTHLLGKLREMR